MDLNALRLFTVVIQSGSLSKASEKLNIPIPTISRKMLELEKSLNTQLLIRSKTGVKPTFLGQQLYEQVYLNIDNLLQAKHLFQENPDLQGKIRISTFSGFTMLFDWIAEFNQQYPAVHIHCEVGDRVVDLVEDGIDIAFRIGKLHTENVIARKVMDGKAILVAHPNFLARFGTPTKPEDLIHFPCIGWARTAHQPLQWEFSHQSLKLPYAIASNDVHTLFHFAKQGNAICQLPTELAQQLIEQNGFVQVLSNEQHSYPIHLLYAAHRYPSSLIKAFVDFCLHKAKGYSNRNRAQV